MKLLFVVLLFFVYSCGKTEKSDLTEATVEQNELRDLLKSIEKLSDPGQDLVFKTSSTNDPNGINFSVKRGDIIFSENEALINGAIIVETLYGQIKHTSSNLSVGLKSLGDGGEFIIVSLSGEVVLDLSNSPGLLRYFNVVGGQSLFEAKITYAKGKDLDFVNMPLRSEDYFYIYQFTAGFFAKLFDMDVAIPVAAVRNEFVINPNSGTFYFEGSIEGLPAMKVPIKRAGIGFSSLGEILYQPKTVLVFPDFFNVGEVNFWEDITFSGSTPAASPIEFNGNLFISGTGQVKLKKVPITIDSDITFGLDVLTDERKGAKFGVDGRTLVGLISDSFEVNIPLAQASITAGATESQQFYYFSGEIEPGFNLSPFGVSMNFGPNAHLSGMIHSESDRSFFRTKAAISFASFNLAEAGVQIDKDGLSVGAKLDFGVAQPRMVGIIDGSGVELTGGINIKVPMKGTKNTLATVVDGALCGFKLVSDGALCGFQTITDGAICGFESITNGAKCGFDTVVGAACIALEAIGIPCSTPRTCNKGPAKSCNKGPPKTCKDLSQPLSCEKIVGKIPDHFFGEASLDIDLTLRGGAGSVGLSSSASGTYCDVLNNCHSIDVNLVSVDISNEKVCVDLDVANVSHESGEVCVNL